MDDPGACAAAADGDLRVRGQARGGDAPAIQQIVDDLIDAMLAGPTPVDLVERLRAPVPSLVICELLGVPYEDHDFFQASSRILVQSDSTTEQVRSRPSAADRLPRRTGRREAHRSRPTTCSLDSPGGSATGELTRRDAAAMARMLLVAGHETTANMIALGTLALLEHPDQLARVRAASDPQLIATAVEELLRYLTIVHSGRRRVALEDIEIDGETIRTGEGVIIATTWATVTRPSSTNPTGWTSSATPASTSPSASAFTSASASRSPAWNSRSSTARSTDASPHCDSPSMDQLAFKHDGVVYGLYELPVTW